MLTLLRRTLKPVADSTVLVTAVAIHLLSVHLSNSSECPNDLGYMAMLLLTRRIRAVYLDLMVRTTFVVNLLVLFIPLPGTSATVGPLVYIELDSACLPLIMARRKRLFYLLPLKSLPWTTLTPPAIRRLPRHAAAVTLTWTL